MKNKKPRTMPNKKRAAKTAINDGGKRDKFTPLPDAPLRESGKSPSEVLMHDIYNPKTMKPDSPEEKAVFTLARYLRTQEAA